MKASRKNDRADGDARQDPCLGQDARRLQVVRHILRMQHRHRIGHALHGRNGHDSQRTDQQHAVEMAKSVDAGQRIGHTLPYQLQRHQRQCPSQWHVQPAEDGQQDL